MASLKHSLTHVGGFLAVRNSTNSTVVHTDVVVIGGGASGSHAAVRLTDYGQDVIVIEKQSNLVSVLNCKKLRTQRCTTKWLIITFVSGRCGGQLYRPR